MCVTFSIFGCEPIGVNHSFSYLYYTLKTVRSSINWLMVLEWLSSLLILSPIQGVPAVLIRDQISIPPLVSRYSRTQICKIVAKPTLSYVT
jgi:hypothetical protein